jgi:hypothetical protein
VPPVSPDSGQPRRPHDQGWDCKGPDLSGVFSANRVVKVGKELGALVQKNIFNGIAILLELVKSLETRRKFKKFQTKFW